MKSIEIIVHCYAEKRPEFAKLLTAQLSSLAQWRGKALTAITVCLSDKDELVGEIVEKFRRRLFCDIKARVTVLRARFEYGLLFRRAIGRNIIAKRSGADIVWFADCDYIFGEGCLDALAASDFTGLAYPKHAWIHRSHQLGDQELAKIKPGELFEPDMTLFKPWTVPYAIGGLQIVDGDTARKGYLDNTRWTKPVPNATDFLNTREDRIYRGLFKTSTQLEIPNLYRFRHSASAFESAESRLKQTEKA